MKTSVSSPYFVAVHVGAGYHSPHSSQLLKALMLKACETAAEHLQSSSVSALAAVEAAIRVLENSPLTNAGLGSCLTLSGNVECDASIMDGTTKAFGAVGAVSGVFNPITVAFKLAQDSTLGPMSLQRIRPLFLVSEGAREWAEQNNIHVVAASSTDPTLGPLGFQVTKDKYRKWQQYVDSLPQDLSDSGNSSIVNPLRSLSETAGMHSSLVAEQHGTVGAVVCDGDGNVAAGCSSGGIWLKAKGRVGHAALHGAGCFAENFGQFAGYRDGIASSASGTGEDLLCSHLCLRCFDQIKAECAKPPVTSSSEVDEDKNAFLACEGGVDCALRNAFSQHFTGSKRGGVIAIHARRTESDLSSSSSNPFSLDVDFAFIHSTPSMGVAYRCFRVDRDLHSCIDSRATISRLPSSSGLQSGRFLASGFYASLRP